MNRIIVLFLLFLPFGLNAQNGPGGVGNTNGQTALQLWLMADSGTGTNTNGAYVTLWKDHSGAGNDLTGHGSGGTAPEFRTRAVGGLPGILFKGNQYFISDSSNNSFRDTQATFFVIHQGRDSGTILNIGLQTMWNEFMLLNNKVYHHISSGNFVEWPHQCTDAVAQDSAIMTTAVFGSGKTDVKYFINSTLTNEPHWESAGNVPNYSLANRYIGLGRRELIGSNISESYTGTVMEVIAFNKRLSAAQIDSVETYLKNKYSISSSGCAVLKTKGINAANQVVSIYPNPGNGTFRIRLPKTSDWEIRLLNAQGQVVKEIALNHANFIEITDIPTGLYFVSAKDAAELITAPVKLLVH
jgi:hypothetical protein